MAKELRWGFCSASKIANDLCHAMDLTQGNRKAAVAASDPERVRQFAQTNNIPRWYVKYEELAADPEVDIVYVSSLNVTHFEHCRLFLNAGKHVLCEKPLTMSLAHTEQLLALAQEKRLFFMEGFWSRFFPVYQEVQHIVQSGEIGQVVQVYSHFHMPGKPGERVTDGALGGSCLLDIGCYTINFADFVFGGGCLPEQVSATGAVFPGTRVDHDVSMGLRYPGGALATLTCSLSGLRPSTAMVCGTEGWVEVQDPMHAPTSYRKWLRHQPSVTTVHKPFPDDPAAAAGSYNYAQGTGFYYQLTHVNHCIAQGLTQSPIASHDVSRRVAQVTHQVFDQILGPRRV